MAIGMIVRRPYEVLIAQRLPDKAFGGLWEFPGGKLELGEAPIQALIREHREELGIEICRCHQLATFEWVHPHVRQMTIVYVIEEYLGTPEPRQSQQLKWVHINHLPAYQMVDMNPLCAALLRNYLDKEKILTIPEPRV